MLGAGLQHRRARGDDRFYVPVKARRNQSLQKQQKQLEENQGNRRARSDKRESSSLKSKVSEDSVLPSVVSRSNLDRFLKSTIPTIPAQYFSKTTMRGWRTCDVEFQAFFTLADLWESFKEWSAYGAGVPLVLDGSDSVIQYYVPYLSGIQLYGESSMRSNIKSRHTGEDSDGDYYRDSSSDVSSEHEFENALKYMRERQGQYILTCEKMDSVSLSDENSAVQEGFSSDDGESGNSRGCLLFEFLEQDTPYSREPLANKIFDLACCFPGLKTLRSCDLLPASWISVAWYPIYRIPTGPTLKDLDACFLTYHSLSTPTGGNGNSQGPVVVYPSEMDGIPKINLPSFGMASYKFEGSMWKENGANELPLVNFLLQEAENWLQLLQVNHPDFQFFASNGYHRLNEKRKLEAIEDLEGSTTV